LRRIFPPPFPALWFRCYFHSLFFPVFPTTGHTQYVPPLYCDFLLFQLRTFFPLSGKVFYPFKMTVSPMLPPLPFFPPPPALNLSPRVHKNYVPSFPLTKFLFFSPPLAVEFNFFHGVGRAGLDVSHKPLFFCTSPSAAPFSSSTRNPPLLSFPFLFPQRDFVSFFPRRIIKAFLSSKKTQPFFF